MHEILLTAKERMKKTCDVFVHELSKVRAGKADPVLLEGIKVDFYGVMSPLKQIASVSSMDAYTLSIKPFDKSTLKAIEKAIQVAELGLNPVNQGDIIRVPFPPLTQERRDELVKMCKKHAEESKVAIRNIRHDANAHCKDFPEDESKAMKDQIQKITDEAVAKVDELLVVKSKTLMQV